MKSAREVLMELEALSEDMSDEVGEEFDATYESFTDDYGDHYSDDVLHTEEAISMQHMLYDELADDIPAQLFRTLH